MRKSDRVICPYYKKELSGWVDELWEPYCKKIEISPFLIIEDDPLVDDVMTHEAEIGYFIAAMQRAGIDQEKIAAAVERLSEVNSMRPYEATRICR